MTKQRLIAFAIAGLLGCTATGGVRSAPLDTATVCAGLYQAQAKALAVSGTVAVPFQWIRQVWTKTEVDLQLEIFWPTGTKLYSGYRCTVSSTGAVTAAPVAQSH